MTNVDLHALDGEPLTQFPPLYPVALRTVMILGVSSETAARLISMAAAAAIVVLTALLVRSCVRSPVLRAGVVVAAVVAPTLTMIDRMAWTEPLFTVVTLAVALVLVRHAHADGPPDDRTIAVLAVLTSIGFLVRYAGLGLVPGVAVALVLVARGRHAWVRPTITYLVASAVVPALWFTRNLVVSGTIGGPPLEARGSLLADVRRVLGAIGRSVVPLTSPSDGTAVVIGLVVAAAGTWAVVRVARRDDGRDIQAIAALVVCLVAHLLMSARLTWVAIGDRMLSPVVPLVLVLLAAVAERSRSAIPASSRRAAVGVAGAVAVLVVIGWTIDSGRATTEARRDGLGYTTDFWRSGRLVSDLTAIPPDVDIVTNDIGGVWYVTRRTPLIGVLASTASEKATARCNGGYYVWFNGRSRPTVDLTPAGSTVVVERPRWSVHRLSTENCDADG